MTKSITVAGGLRDPAHVTGATGSRTIGACPDLAGPDNGGRRHGHPARVLVAGADTGGQLAIIETCAVRGGEPPRHVHRREDEIVYVLAGDVTFWVGGARRHATVGACLVLPRDVEHGYAVESGEATLLSLFHPAGLEGCLEELGQGAGGPDFERLVTVAARHGVEITGSPPEPLADDGPVGGR